MRARALCLLGIGWALLLSSAPVSSQTGVNCPDTLTIQGCKELLVPTGSAPEGKEEAAQNAANAAARREHAKPAGADLGQVASGSSIRDFLPRIAGALLTPGTTASEVGALGLKANFHFPPDIPFGIRNSVQTAIVFHKAEVNGKLLDAVPSALQSGFQRRAVAGFSPFSDVSVTAAVNPETEHLGRDPATHLADIQRIAQALLPDLHDSRDALAGPELTMYLAAIQSRVGSATENPLVDGASPADCSAPQPEDWKLGCLRAPVRDSVVRFLTVWGAARGQWLRIAEDSLKNTGFFRIAELMNNQPQINASVEYRGRDRLAGPSEWTGSARWEVGRANWNAMRRRCNGSVTASCLRDYVQRAAPALARGERAYLQADWKRRDAWRVSLPSDSVQLSLGTASTYAVTGGYGTFLDGAADAANRDRFDLTAKWDIARGDQLRQNRFVATAFLTHKLSDQSTLLLGATYANRSEFVGDVTSHLGANFGLTYKISPPEKK
jgi:hypothetical protein